MNKPTLTPNPNPNLDVSVVSEARELFSSVYDSSLPSEDLSDLLTTSTVTGGTLDVNSAPDALLAAFTEARLRKIIARYPKHKSAGPDSLHAKVFDALSSSPVFIRQLCDLFHLCIHLGTTPSSWNTSNTCLLAKQQGDTCPVTKTRPVSLTNMARRYFEALLLRYIQDLPAFQLHRNQAGFKRGFSTLTQILLANESCTLPESLRHQVSLYLDLEKAFDRLKHRPLLEALRARGCDSFVLALIHSLMMRACQSHLIVNGYRTQPIRRNRGVFQGSILAPLLFNIAIDDLANELDALEDPEQLPCFLFFADDMRLSSHRSETWRLQAALQFSEAWAARYGLRFGLSKCAVLGAATGDFHIQGEPIEEATSYKYLGLEFTKHGVDWKAYTDRVVAKTKGMLRFLFLKATDHWNHSTRLALVKTYVLSLLQYGLGLYGHWTRLRRRLNQLYTDIMPMLDDIHKDSLEFVFGFSKPATVLESMGNLKDPNDSLTMACASTTRHLKRTHQTNPIMTVKTLISNGMALFTNHTSRSLIRQCFDDPHYTRWSKHCEALKEKNPRSRQIPTLKTFLHKGFHEARMGKSALVRYISPRCRTPNGKLDLTLFAGDAALRDEAVKWRAGKQLINRNCDICLKKMTRTHCNVCDGLARNGVFDDDDFSTFNDFELVGRRREFGTKDNYTFLDFLLNHKKYSSFLSVLTFLKENSSPS